MCGHRGPGSTVSVFESSPQNGLGVDPVLLPETQQSGVVEVERRLQVCPVDRVATDDPFPLFQSPGSSSRSRGRGGHETSLTVVRVDRTLFLESRRPFTLVAVEFFGLGSSLRPFVQEDVDDHDSPSN